MSVERTKITELSQKIEKLDQGGEYLGWYAVSKYSLDEETRKFAKEQFRTLAGFACGMADGVYDIANDYINYREGFLKKNWKYPELISSDFTTWLLNNF